FNLVNLLSYTFISQWTFIAFLWPCVFERFILIIKAVIAIRMLPKTGRGKIFIKSNGLSFVSLIVCNHGLLPYSVHLFIYWFVIVTSIHGLIAQKRHLKAIIHPFK